MKNVCVYLYTTLYRCILLAHAPQMCFQLDYTSADDNFPSCWFTGTSRSIVYAERTYIRVIYIYFHFTYILVILFRFFFFFSYLFIFCCFVLKGRYIRVHACDKFDLRRYVITSVCACVCVWGDDLHAVFWNRPYEIRFAHEILIVSVRLYDNNTYHNRRARGDIKWFQTFRRDDAADVKTSTSTTTTGRFFI